MGKKEKEKKKVKRRKVTWSLKQLKKPPSTARGISIRRKHDANDAA